MTRNKRGLVTHPTIQSTDLLGGPFLTVEVALWILVTTVALALRLARLDVAPLNSHEAREALFAWRAVTGQGMPQTGYSPLLFSLNVLTFVLCGASDALARFWPALCGGVLALMPCLLRRRIGRVGALAAGLYLALSPTLLFASRQLDGAVIGALASMAFLGGLARFLDAGSDSGRRRWFALSAVGLALAVTSSPSAYGLLVTLGLTWLSLTWYWPDRGVRWLWALIHSHLRHGLAVFLLVGLALSTALGWNPAGLGAGGDLLPAWMARFSPASNIVASPLTLLALYELLAFLLGFGGLMWAIRRRHRLGMLLGMWGGMGLLLLLLMPSRTGFDILWVLLPQAILAGLAVEQLVQGLQERGDWLSEGLHVPVVVLLWVHLYLVLARYAVYGNHTDLALALLTVALQGLLAVIFALATRFDAALRAVAVGTGIVLLAVMLSAGWDIGYVHPSDPRVLLVPEPTAAEVRDLVQTLRHLSWRRTGFPLTLPFTLEAAPDSVLVWHLRDFTDAYRVERLGAGGAMAEVAPVLVTTRLDLRDLEVQNLVDSDAEFAGQGFALHRSWDLGEVACTWEWPPRCQAAVGWWLFRDGPASPTVSQEVVLWLASDEE